MQGANQACDEPRREMTDSLHGPFKGSNDFSFDLPPERYTNGSHFQLEDLIVGIFDSSCVVSQLMTKDIGQGAGARTQCRIKQDLIGCDGLSPRSRHGPESDDNTVLFPGSSPSIDLRGHSGQIPLQMIRLPTNQRRPSLQAAKPVHDCSDVAHSPTLHA